MFDTSEIASHRTDLCKLGGLEEVPVPDPSGKCQKIAGELSNASVGLITCQGLDMTRQSCAILYVNLRKAMS